MGLSTIVQNYTSVSAVLTTTGRGGGYQTIYFEIRIILQKNHLSSFSFPVFILLSVSLSLFLDPNYWRSALSSEFHIVIMLFLASCALFVAGFACFKLYWFLKIRGLKFEAPLLCSSLYFIASASTISYTLSFALSFSCGASAFFFFSHDSILYSSFGNLYGYAFHSLWISSNHVPCCS
jgi:hypothetical protein